MHAVQGSTLEGQGNLAVVQAGQGRRSFKRRIPPGLQIAVNKELLAVASPQLQVFQQQHGDECCPNLDVQRVGWCPQKF